MIGNEETEQERHELEELKGQLGTCNVAPPDTLGFGKRFAEIISRLSDVTESKRTSAKKKKV